jgi:TonB family protein
MRSTTFVIGSLLLHFLILAVLIIGPQRVMDWSTAQSQPDSQTQSEPITIPTEASFTGETVDVESVPSTTATTKIETKKLQKTKIAAPAKKQDSAVAQKPAAATAKATETKSTEADDSETEALSQDVKDSAEPAPVIVKDVSEAGQGQSLSQSPSPSQNLRQGGQTKGSAVSFLNLKQAKGNRSPSYPTEARREGRQGTVELLYRVTTEGSVEDIQVTRSSGHSDLDDEAIAAIGAFRFEPGQEGWARHPISFKLKSVEAISTRQEELGAQTE